MKAIIEVVDPDGAVHGRIQISDDMVIDIDHIRHKYGPDMGIRISYVSLEYIQ